MDNAPVLCVENVTKRFLGTVALQDVSMKLYQNEILAVMGENGAGKSTLMKIISGAYPHGECEGVITMNGAVCKFNNPTDSENMGIAMIYQELNLELDLTVAENIMLGRCPKTKLNFIDWAKTKQEAKKALDKLNADIDVNITVRALSPSMQQLVSIARALVRDPKILILDEPTSVLTETETESLMAVLNKLKAEGISSLYISHKLDEVFSLCDRLIVLRDGNFISEHKKADVYDSKLIIEEMIGRKLDVMYPVMERTMSREEVLTVKNFKVPHTYALGKNIIEDVSFTLYKGEILGLCGLVGSGRSELVSSIFGIIPKTRGELFIKGKKADIQNPQDAKKHGIGLLTEDRKKNGFIATMSICHNMTLTVLDIIKGRLLLNKTKEQKMAGEYFDTLKVKAPSLDTLISTLSGGNQQKVILTKWLLTNLKILFLDEPTRGIDVGTKAEIYKIMLELSAKGISIIMISSELPELLAMCDRFVVLGKGRVQTVLSRDEANEVNILKAASNT